MRSRWIDAEKELKELKKMQPDVKDESSIVAVTFASLILEHAPSVDIVCCGECEHNLWLPTCDYKCIWDDDFADRPQTPEDFCSYGKRMDY